MPSPSPAVHVHAARLAYDGRPLFDDLDFEAPAGAWTCLLGPSGVGKSSLLKIIAGLLPAGPDSRIECHDGLSLNGRSSWMAQQDMLLPWCSVLRNVVIGYRLRGEPPPWDRARRLLAEVGLGEQADSLPGSLSGGMRQRVALVRTLIEDRPIILMDEPFSALDAVTRLKLQTLAAEMLAGRTVLMVTHDPLEALRLGHRIHVMAGRPARLSEVAVPAAAPPRDVADPAVLAAQAELLKRLAEA